MENGGKMRCRSMKSARKLQLLLVLLLCFVFIRGVPLQRGARIPRHIQLARLRLWCMRNEKFNFFIFTERKKNENYNSIRFSFVVILSLPLVLLFLMMLLNDKNVQGFSLSLLVNENQVVALTARVRRKTCK